MLTVVCVLKSGGWCTEPYITNIRESLKEFLHIPYKFVCLTDLKHLNPLPEYKPLVHGYDGWWSKLEVFYITDGPVLFLDLDSLILSDMKEFVELAINCPQDTLYMIRPLTNRDTYGSGFMMWNGDLSFIIKEFNADIDINKHEWDQRYIVSKTKEKGVIIKGIQDYYQGLYSFKLHCFPRKPEDAKIIAFHGKPRPIQAARTVGWVKSAWKGGE